MKKPRRFLVYMERLDTDPYKLIWRMRESKEHDSRWGSRLHAGWYSIDSFDEQGRLDGYLGDFCSTQVAAYTVETALRIGMKRIFVVMNYGFINYPWDKFTHVFEWEKTCKHYKGEK
jgi:hypothetical protein